MVENSKSGEAEGQVGGEVKAAPVADGKPVEKAYTGTIVVHVKDDSVELERTHCEPKGLERAKVVDALHKAAESIDVDGKKRYIDFMTEEL
jgi:hypothetical protein